ncbi:MAG: nucleotidyltransferase family protein [Anaerolineae bacterium]|nr:nucleotidyltransferase family protein [Anaerolineae bacterium]
MVRISLDQSEIAEFCRKRHIRRLSLFGSVLREDFRPDSDLDVLVEFEPGHVPGLDFFTMEMELSEILGHEVDLNTPGFLSPYFRDQVLAEAEVQFQVDCSDELT